MSCTGYVLMRSAAGGGGFVAPPGRRRSYTRSITAARVYESLDEALADRCPESERVVPIHFALLVEDFAKP